MKHFIFFIALVLVGCSSSKNTSPNNNTVQADKETIEKTIPQEPEAGMEKEIKKFGPVEDGILGSWQWVSTTFNRRGSGSRAMNPENTKKNLVLTYHENYTVDILINDKKEATVKYKIIHSTDGVMFIDYNPHRPDLLLQKGPVDFGPMDLVIKGGYNDAGGNMLLKRID